VPNHRQRGRASRNRPSLWTPTHRRETRNRRGKVALIVALLLGIGSGGAVYLDHQLGWRTHVRVNLTATDDGRRAQAANRDFNRLGASASPSAGVSPSASAAPLPSATMRSSSPAPSPTRSRTSVPAGCSAYTGNQLIACKLLPSFGFSVSQMSPLVKLWNGESDWQTSATNPSSGAYGIPQSLPGSKMGSVGSDWRTNPATQIKWGLGYIKDTYGTPAQAYATWLSRSPHWY
jgi:hypothetical protein